MYDVLFKNGIIIDGRGNPAFQSDVAVSSDGIAEVAATIPAENASTVYDIRDCYLAPGFIDLHTHSDFPLLLDGRAMSAVHQGVTTQVIGNCGFAPAPLRRQEDVQRNVFCFQGPYSPSWSDFGGYLDVLSQIETGTNTAALAGHGALRSKVAGYENRRLGIDELKNLEFQLNAALEAGAFGLSTGLEYAPGINADHKELEMLCRTVAEENGLYATHVRNRDEGFREGFGEAFRTAETSGVRMQISHAVPKYGAPPEAAAWFLDELHRIAGRTDVAADVIPYEWGPTSLSAVLPKELLMHSPAEIAELLNSPAVRDTVIQQKKHFWLHFRDGLWDQVLLYHSEKFPGLVGKTAYEIGKFFHTDPFNGLLSVLQAEGASMFSVLMMGKIKSRSHLEVLIQDPLVGVISDGMSLASDGPLANLIWSPGCYGWVPHFFQRFVGEDKLLSIEAGVAKITGFPARRLGLTDRGVIRVGAKADITVFDKAQLKEKATMDHPQEYAEGFRYVMCNGINVIEAGKYTGRKPGRLLRKT